MSIRMSSGIVFSAVDRLKMDSVVEINGRKQTLGYLVELGKASRDIKTREFSRMIEGDLTSEMGLRIGFPIAFLYETLRAEGLI